MSTTNVTTTSTQGSQVPSPKKVAKKVAPAAEGEQEKKPRKPTLKEKYSRFLVSNYSLIQFLSSKGLITDEAVESAYSEIKLLAPVEDQEAFYESYLTESKTTKKAMTKFIRERNKPPKAPKKSRAKKSDGDAPAAPKKPRAKKNTTVANDTEVDVVAQATANDGGASDLVNELTAAATAAQVTPENKPAAAAVEAPGAPKKERKPRAKKADSEPKAKKETAKKETKAKKSKKEVVAEVVAAPVVQEDEEDEEIHTQEIEIGGKSYLIDGDNNIYSVDTHDEIGTYDAATNTINANL